MIAFIKGKIHSYTENTVILEHQDMGYEIFYPHVDRIRLDQEITIYTYLHATENDLSLYGFESLEEKNLFLRLISVKGLGPKTGLGMLTKCTANQMIQAIETNDVAFLTKLPGIGKKTASQIILDLKGKLVQSEDHSTTSFNQEIEDAKEALKNLGYKQKEVDEAASAMKVQEGLDSQDYLKQGLKFLMFKNNIG